ncbi:MAG: Uma2 family endonuclease, partial [Dehalococcoidia bacterium]
IQKPMPNFAHSRLQTYLVVLLYQFLAQAHLGEVLTEWRCIFGPAGQERVFVPDLVVVTNERLPIGDARDSPYLYTAPDLAIEILSPGQSAKRFADKVHFYLLHGVRLLWVIDPEDETVLILKPGEDSVTLTIADILDGGDLFPGFRAPVADLFARLRA